MSLHFSVSSEKVHSGLRKGRGEKGKEKEDYETLIIFSTYYVTCVRHLVLIYII